MEGRRRGPWLFLSLAPVCSAQAFIPAHTHTDTQRGLRANAGMHVSTISNTHMRLIHTDNRGTLCTSSHAHAHTHTLQNTATLAVMEPEENGKISYYFLCSNLERMCFFFSLLFLPQSTYWFFFPSKLLGSFCILYIEHWSSPHWNALFQCSVIGFGSDLRGYKIGWKSLCQHKLLHAFSLKRILSECILRNHIFPTKLKS